MTIKDCDWEPLVAGIDQLTRESQLAGFGLGGLLQGFNSGWGVCEFLVANGEDCASHPIGA